MSSRTFPWRRLVFAVLALVGAFALTGPAAQAETPEASSSASGNSPLGRWNYDQPDSDGTRNIALLRCPEGSTPATCVPARPDGQPLEIPQVGDIVFTEEGGEVVGRTDLGCTWRFTRTATGVEMTDPGQYCFNQVYGVGYTITRWSVEIHGNHQHEVITALSHRPTGDLEFVLEDGRRTRAPEPSRLEATLRYAGTWEYTPADFTAGVNVVITHPGPDGQPVGYSAQTGAVSFTANRDGTITARTPDGCRWTLVARGNTAELAGDEQTCQLPGETVTVKHWAIASDGFRQASVLQGTRDAGGSTSGFLLTIGSLRRTSLLP
jgi:hypothetical protein